MTQEDIFPIRNFVVDKLSTYFSPEIACSFVTGYVKDRFFASFKVYFIICESGMVTSVLFT